MNPVVVAPAATVTELGTVSAVAVFVRVMTAPPLGAAPVRATVHVVLVFAVKLAAVHSREETSTVVTSEIDAVADDPLSVAEIVAV